MILVFGQTGQVATELRRRTEVISLGRAEADLTDPATCIAAIEYYRPAAVINAAAYTAVDRAEQEEALATVINGDAPGAMAQTAARLKIPFVHISTDYVFDGSGAVPRQPEDPTGPLSAYGRSKLAGERAVLGAAAQAVVLRTSWVFSAHGSNFVKTMLRLSQTRDMLTIVADQIGGPTPACAVADACLRIANALRIGQGATGVYHISGAPDVSWADFARHIFRVARRDVTVTDIPASAYPTPAPRPANSRLDCTSLINNFGVARPNWRASVKAVIEELKKT